MTPETEELTAAGIARLKRAARGEDFFQSFPVTEPGDDLVQWYWREFGRIINSDCAKMAFLKDGYVPGDPESVRKFHPQAAELVRQLVEAMFQSAPPGTHLYLMAGGNGSGKSTFCDGMRPLLGKDWVIDATLGSLEPARRTISRALAQGLKPVVIRIMRPLREAWDNGVLKRAAHGSHVTPRDVFDNTHAVVPLNIQKLKSEFPPSLLPVIEIGNDR